jgi:hypothetical protein
MRAMLAAVLVVVLGLLTACGSVEPPRPVSTASRAIPTTAPTTPTATAAPKPKSETEELFEAASRPFSESERAHRPTARVRVGVTISEYSANGPSRNGQPVGLPHARIVIDALQGPRFDLIPIVEKGTRQQGDTKTLMDHYFENKPWIDMNDADALSRLDVLFVVNCPNMKQDSLDAIEKAVKSGVPLIAGSWFGYMNPGYTDQVTRLHGMDKAAFGRAFHQVKTKVMKSHPLLGTLKEGDEIDVKPNGVYGFLTRGEPLLQLPNLNEIPVTDGVPQANFNQEAGMIFAPLYISSLGHTKIVGINWAMYDDVPKALSDATRNDFYARCVLWLAGRPLE